MRRPMGYATAQIGKNLERVLQQHSTDFMERSVKAGKPFFHWHNTAHARLDAPFA